MATITDEQAEQVTNETITEYPQTWDDEEIGHDDQTDTVTDLAETDCENSDKDNGLAEGSSNSNVAGSVVGGIPTAAYCRVSTNKDIQDGSFEVQRDYFRNLINSDPRLRLVDIYGDQGKSGRYERQEGIKPFNR